MTFLFTDLEGSTRLWEDQRERMPEVLVRHDALLRDAITGHGGVVLAERGDGMDAVFASARDALVAAVEFQLGAAGEANGDVAALRSRVGLHSGDGALRSDGHYVNAPLNRGARLMGIAHGGQVLVSDATAALVRDDLPPGVVLVDLGAHRLRDLASPIVVFQLVHPGLPRQFPPLQSLDAFPGNLPLQVTSFVGREREMARTVDALGSSRVVTLTGVGGVGKTRLAQQVAAEMLDRYRDGAWLVELAAVRDPDDVIGLMAAVFGVTERPGLMPQNALVDFLRSKHLLMVLDNCEDVLDAVGDLVEQIERTCPGVSVLATSREPLAIDGEHVLGVRSLAVPGEDPSVAELEGLDAVRLFVQRAQAHDSDFTLTQANVPSVAQICRRLDGIPLAIELAAARTTTMTSAELAAALARRLDVLAGARRRAVKRHQTLRATIDWSYDLLDDDERRLLARLSVFAGCCTRGGAETVCGYTPLESRAVFGLLSVLVARSLVEAVRDGTKTRFRLLETIREYGEERLAEFDEVTALRDRHRDYYAAFADEWDANVEGPDQMLWGNRLLAERDDVLAAWSWAIDTADVDAAIPIVRCTLPGAQVGYAVRVPSLEPLVTLAEATGHPGYAFVASVAAAIAASGGDVLRAEQLAELARTGDRDADPRIDAVLAMMDTSVAVNRGDHHAAAQAALRGAVAWRRAGRVAPEATGLAVAANAYTASGASARAEPLAEEGLRLARTVGMPGAIVLALLALGSAVSRTDQSRARACLEEALEMSAALGYESGQSLGAAAFLASRLRDRRLTLELCDRAIRHFRWANQRWLLVLMFELVAAALARSRPEAAVRLRDVVQADRAGGTVEVDAVALDALTEIAAALSEDP